MDTLDPAIVPPFATLTPAEMSALTRGAAAVVRTHCYGRTAARAEPVTVLRTDRAGVYLSNGEYHLTANARNATRYEWLCPAPAAVAPAPTFIISPNGDPHSRLWAVSERTGGDTWHRGDLSDRFRGRALVAFLRRTYPGCRVVRGPG